MIKINILWWEKRKLRDICYYLHEFLLNLCSENITIMQKLKFTIDFLRKDGMIIVVGGVQCVSHLIGRWEAHFWWCVCREGFGGYPILFVSFPPYKLLHHSQLRRK